VLAVSLDGKVAVVTGASRGLGAACARSLAEAGADVALLARKAEDLDEVKADVEAHGRQALAIAVDVTDEAAIEAAADHVVTIFGRVDVLVNNAGIAPVGPLLELDLAELRQVFETNVFGTFLCARAFGAHMIAQHRGTVINIGSIAGIAGEPELTAYAASKGAVIAFTKALAVEWARHNVTVNCLAAGHIRTDLNKAALDDPKIGPKMVQRIPLRRVGQPEEIGPLVAYLASDLAAYMTGSVIVFDGGQTAR
jgi:NAD(P)-dependent dehydrogenase (short-subunit alcohol dehydrogenase family)